MVQYLFVWKWLVSLGEGVWGRIQTVHLALGLGVWFTWESIHKIDMSLGARAVAKMKYLGYCEYLVVMLKACKKNHLQYAQEALYAKSQRWKIISS